MGKETIWKETWDDELDEIRNKVLRKVWNEEEMRTKKDEDK